MLAQIYVRSPTCVVGLVIDGFFVMIAGHRPDYFTHRNGQVY
jgi:hypothetical protein